MNKQQIVDRAVAISEACHAAEKAGMSAYAHSCELGALLARFAVETGMNTQEARKTLAQISNAQASQLEGLSRVNTTHVRAQQQLKVMGDFPVTCPEAKIEQSETVVEFKAA